MFSCNIVSIHSFEWVLKCVQSHNCEIAQICSYFHRVYCCCYIVSRCSYYHFGSLLVWVCWRRRLPDIGVDRQWKEAGRIPRRLITVRNRERANRADPCCEIYPHSFFGWFCCLCCCCCCCCYCYCCLFVLPTRPILENIRTQWFLLLRDCAVFLFRMTYYSRARENLVSRFFAVNLYV